MGVFTLFAAVSAMADNCATYDAPVCGTDGAVYSNECEANLQGANLTSNLKVCMEGRGLACHEECPCAKHNTPVCSDDGTAIYRNPCYARREKANVSDTLKVCINSTYVLRCTDDCGGDLQVSIEKPTAEELEKRQEERKKKQEERKKKREELKKKREELKKKREELKKKREERKKAREENRGDGKGHRTGDGPYGAQTPEDCICTATFAPVCSKNGTVYGNECSAICAGESISETLTYCNGVCKESCTEEEKEKETDKEASDADDEDKKRQCTRDCTREYIPVCTEEGRRGVHANKCVAKCSNKTIDTTLTVCQGRGRAVCKKECPEKDMTEEEDIEDMHDEEEDAMEDDEEDAMEDEEDEEETMEGEEDAEDDVYTEESTDMTKEDKTDTPGDNSTESKSEEEQYFKPTYGAKTAGAHTACITGALIAFMW